MKNFCIIPVLFFSMNIMVCAQGNNNVTNGFIGVEYQMKITVNGYKLTSTMVNNSSAQALKELLTAGPITINMRDYGNMEKVGGFGRNLPTNDERITTEPGDLILYQGNQFVIYYAPNTWSFTRLGKINGVSREELINILGEGNVTVILETTE